MHISQYKSNKINPKSKISRSKIFIILKNTRREEDKRSPPLQHRPFHNPRQNTCWNKRTPFRNTLRLYNPHTASEHNRDRHSPPPHSPKQHGINYKSQPPSSDK